MPLIPIDNLGKFGIITDDNAYNIPPEAFTAGGNIRFTTRGVQKGIGYQAGFGTPTVPPYHTISIQGTTNFYWLYAGLAKIYSYTGGSHVDATRAAGSDYVGTTSDLWNSANFNGIALLNNGVDIPQVYLADVNAKCLDLANWPANFTAKVVRTYLTFILALDTKLSGVRDPTQVRWSDPAEPGAVPTSWDFTDPTTQAGKYSLNVTGDYLIDCLPLKTMNVLYKEDSIWGMQYIGAPAIFRFWNISLKKGLLAANCIVDIGGGHIFLAFGDVCFTDGQNVISIIDDKRKSALFNDIDTTAYEKSFLFYSVKTQEVWICYPRQGSTACDKAYVWNVKTKAWGVQDIPDLNHANLGILGSEEDQTWDADTEIWDTDFTVWDERNFNPMLKEIAAVSASNTKIYRMYQGQTFDGSSYTSWVEREGIALVGVDREGKPKVDKTKLKFLKAIWPKIIAPSGTVFTIHAGEQEHIGGSVTWNGPYTYTVGSEEVVHVAATGRAVGVRFSCAEDVDWHMEGYSIDIEIVGE